MVRNGRGHGEWHPEKSEEEIRHGEISYEHAGDAAKAVISIDSEKNQRVSDER